MKEARKSRRLLAWVLVFALAFTTVFSNGITAEAATAKAVKKVTVKIGSKNVTKKTYSLQKGKSKTLKVTVSPSGSKKSVTYKTNKQSVATVSKKGKVTAKKKGTAKITITVTGKNKKKKKTWVKIKVTEPKSTTTQQPTTQPTTKPTTQNTTGTDETTEKPTPEENKTVEVTAVILAADAQSISIDGRAQITATVVPANATNKTVTYTSSNPAVVTVDASGLVKAVSVGTAIITGTASNGVQGTIAITVNPVAVTGITVEEKEKTLTVGSTYSVTTKIVPEGATNQKISFQTNDPSVATVSDTGVVTAIKAGEAVITAITDDGHFSVTVKITVQNSSIGSADDIDIVLTDDSMKEYWDENAKSYVALTGSNANVRLVLTENGKPVGNQSVSLKLEPLYGTTEDLYAIEGKDQQLFKTTQDNGTVDFPLALTSDNSKVKVTDGEYQSYKLTASSSADSSVTKTATISFVSVGVDSVKVVNGLEKDYDVLIPGTAAQESDATPVVSTKSNNGEFEQQYVISQQADQTVTLKAYAYLQFPATATEVTKGDYSQTIDFSSGSYGTYNDETNEATTKIIESIPAGLEYASLNFGDLSLSEYTKLVVRFYEKDESGNKTDNLLKEYVYTKEQINADAKTLQIPVQPNNEIYAVIALISEGQVDTDNNKGYTLGSITGRYSGKAVAKGSTVILNNNNVNWSVDENFSRATNNDTVMSKEQAGQYINEMMYLSDTYNYSYIVPTFPHVGNAIIRVTDKNGDKIANFAYPIQNLRNGSVYQNVNTIADFSRRNYGYAVQIADQEYQNQVGTVTGSGNYATIKSDNNKTGYTPIKVTFDLSQFGITDTSDYDMYSYVQWAPIPTKEEQKAAEDFYAVMGQQVEITAQLVDGTGNPVSQAGRNISFYYGADKQSLADSGFVKGTLTTQTDAKGQATFTIGNKDVTGGIENLLLEKLTAEASDYDVRFYIGNSDHLVDYANIHWVDLGLEFVDKVAIQGEQSSITVTSIDGQSKEVPGNTEVKLDRTAGSSWLFGLNTIAETAFVPAEDNAYVKTEYSISKVEGVNVSFKATNESSLASFEDKRDGSFEIKNTKLGITPVTGSISGISQTGVAFTVVKKVTEYDQYGNIVNEYEEKVGEYKNVGTYDSVMYVKADITLNINWTEDGINTSIVFSGNSAYADATKDEKVSVKVTDNYGNLLKDKKVAYTVKDTDGNVVVEGDGYTNDSGVVEITIPAPNKNVTYTISATVEGKYSDSKDIIFRLNEDVSAFVITKAVLNRTAKTITITTSNDVDFSTLNKDAFVVENVDLDVPYTVVSAAKGNTERTIILTLDTNVNITEVPVEKFVLTVGKYPAGGQEQYIRDIYAQPLEEGEILVTE